MQNSAVGAADNTTARKSRAKKQPAMNVNNRIKRHLNKSYIANFSVWQLQKGNWGYWEWLGMSICKKLH